MTHATSAGVHKNILQTLEQMYDAIERPNIDRNELKCLTDVISAFTMTAVDLADPVNQDAVELADEGFTLQQARLVMLLKTRPGHVFSRQTIQEHIKVKMDALPPKTIDVIVSYVRRKLVRLGYRYRIETVWGLGYRFVENTVPPAMWPRKDMRPSTRGSPQALVKR